MTAVLHDHHINLVVAELSLVLEAPQGCKNQFVAIEDHVLTFIKQPANFQALS